MWGVHRVSGAGGGNMLCTGGTMRCHMEGGWAIVKKGGPTPRKILGGQSAARGGNTSGTCPLPQGPPAWQLQRSAGAWCAVQGGTIAA
jgi:hypothetical protein